MGARWEGWSTWVQNSWGGATFLAKEKNPSNNKYSLPCHWQTKVEIKLLYQNISLLQCGEYGVRTFLLVKTLWRNRCAPLFCSRSLVRGAMPALPWALTAHAMSLNMGFCCICMNDASAICDIYGISDCLNLICPFSRCSCLVETWDRPDTLSSGNFSDHW